MVRFHVSVELRLQCGSIYIKIQIAKKLMPLTDFFHYFKGAKKKWQP